MQFLKTDLIKKKIINVCNEMLEKHPDILKEVDIYYNPDDEAGMSYVKSKAKILNEIGVKVNHLELTSRDGVMTALKNANKPLMFQLPLHKDIEVPEGGLESALGCMPWFDIDCFSEEYHDMNPCTPQAVLEIIHHVKNIPLDKAWTDTEGNNNIYNGLTICVVGRGKLIGNYLIKKLVKCGANVLTANRSTSPYVLEQMYKMADIIILATTERAMFDYDHQIILKDNALVIDCGVFVNPENGKLEGCVKKYGPNAVEERSLHPADEVIITSVPGGVGPLTVVNVALNAVRLLVEKNKGEN